MHERSTLENLLRGALSRDEISVHYQPEFDLADNRLVRFEALARWTHPTLGEIPPDKFIPIAEESGLMLPSALYHGAGLYRGGPVAELAPHPIQVAVNVSPIQFRSEGFVEEVSVDSGAHRTPA